MTPHLTTAALPTPPWLLAEVPAEIELLDIETCEVPQRLSHDERLDHTGGEGRRQSQIECEQDDDQ